MNVFISYRRSDSQDFVGRLADQLRDAPGIGDLFLDVDEIDAGEDFQKRIEKGLEDCGVALIVIGRDWRGETLSGGQTRIFEDGDFVRMEVRQALKSETRVLPVLANGAFMPVPAALPEDIRRITALNGVSVRHSDFERDVDHLLDVIFARKKPGRAGAFLRRHPVMTRALQSLAGAVAAFVALTLLLVALNAVTPFSLSDLTGDNNAAATLIMTPFSLSDLTGDNNAAATLIIILVVIAGALAPLLIRRRRLQRL
jgi:hypothetical protein